MHQLIAAPFFGGHFIVKPGGKPGLRLPSTLFNELAQSDRCPPELIGPIKTAFDIDLDQLQLRDVILLRAPSPLPSGGFGRASWEINLGCNWDCEHCYLALKKFEGLPWEGKAKLLETMRDAGVLFLQITGGEPTIDPDFVQAYGLAAELGMMLHISTNASQLHQPRILELFDRYPPWRIMGADDAQGDRIEVGS
ncbi:radical SAM protein [Catenulispora rubra]|uniref:radical SAM protein n=1 Tax=Catenulispora rubra TaxID=280293 RepID=UPI001891FC07|nr:radical SAM protein [Catenulispora rubra]